MSSTQAGVSSSSASGMWSSVDVAQNKTSNTWPAPPVTIVTIEYLVVAGGGGGAHDFGGGGGAGGLLSNTFVQTAGATYTVFVGSGGSGAASAGGSGTNGELKLRFKQQIFRVLNSSHIRDFFIHI